MVSATDTTLDLHLLERIGLLGVIWFLFLSLTALEAGLRAENDVLAQGGGVRAWAWWLASLTTHLGPCAALGNTGVLLLLDDCSPDALGALDALAVLVYEDCNYGFGAVLVLCNLWCGNRVGEVWSVIVICPVGASRRVLYCCHDVCM